jgi:hypothetical protein
MPTKPRRSTSSSDSKICRPWSITASAASVIRGYLSGLSRPEQVEYANNRQINCKQGRISCQFARLPLRDQSRHQSNETLRERKCETTKQRQLRSNRQPEHSPAATGRFAIALSYRRSLWSTSVSLRRFGHRVAKLVSRERRIAEFSIYARANASFVGVISPSKGWLRQATRNSYGRSRLEPRRADRGRAQAACSRSGTGHAPTRCANIVELKPEHNRRSRPSGGNRSNLSPTIHKARLDSFPK